MSFLTEPMIDKISIGNKIFGVNPAFDIVLEVQRLYSEEELSSSDKLNQALRMLTTESEWKLQQLSVKEKLELMNEIYHRCINVRKRPPNKQQLPCLDFEYDGEFIYASFMLDYGIDLVDMQGYLPWKKFLALFQGLSEGTKIREVMHIRNMKIPEFNGKNSKEIQKIQELKSYYALPIKGGGGKQGLDLLFSTLERMAVGRDG